MRVLTTILK